MCGLWTGGYLLGSFGLFLKKQRSFVLSDSCVASGLGGCLSGSFDRFLKRQPNRLERSVLTIHQMILLAEEEEIDRQRRPQSDNSIVIDFI
jgi:hypothetical protein